jgi:hypothetical protein
VEKFEVTSVSFDISSTLFTLQTSTGVRRARIVVFAIGAGLPPALPPNCVFCGTEERVSVSRIFARDLSSGRSTILPPHALDKISKVFLTSLAVVEGGLASAQVTHLVSTRGASGIHFIVRGLLKTKHFDVDLEWVGKHKNREMSAFYGADSEEEEEKNTVKAARGVLTQSTGEFP